MNKKQKEILEEEFNIYKDGGYWELERWTDGGVDMTIDININDDIIEVFDNYIDNFDIDEEIDLYRQDKKYREAFRITQSVRDFEDWIKDIENIKSKLESVK